MSDTSTEAVNADLTETTLEVRLKELEKKIDAVLDDDLVSHASIVFTIKGESEPQACRKGHFYDVAAMVNYVMEAYRAKASIDLGLKTEPCQRTT